MKEDKSGVISFLQWFCPQSLHGCLALFTIEFEENQLEEIC